MQDDDKQPSYERLDETNPERNRRSFFDWLRGKEETEEEKLRKKLDEELKEAARKRATEFEEERRVEEEREVAETRKLKKRWRAKLVEKSKKLLEGVTERGDEPANGYEIARLMVAERIVKLHDLLTTEDLRRSEVKALKIHIDFMGLLSEKLDRPALEVPEEVEELYQTIAASVEEVTGETPPEKPNEQPETAPASEADAAYTAFASSIVRAIQRALRHENSSEPSGSGGTEDPGTRDSAPLPVTNRQTDDVPAAAEQLLSVVKGAALSGEALRKEIFHTEQARNLAEVVEKAAVIDRYVAQEAKLASGATEIKKNETVTGHTQESPRQEKGFELLPNKKIKHLSELELVTLAGIVEVGSGRLLSDVYKKGELDREGLVKVLEKYHKGQDYRSEFTLRREKWRRHKQASPEYLAEPAAAQTPTATSRDDSHTSPEKIKKQPEKIGNRVTSLALAASQNKLRNIGQSQEPSPTPAQHIAPEMARRMSNAKERLKRQGQVMILLASVLFVVIIFIAVIELNGR